MFTLLHLLDPRVFPSRDAVGACPPAPVVRFIFFPSHVNDRLLSLIYDARLSHRTDILIHMTQACTLDTFILVLFPVTIQLCPGVVPADLRPDGGGEHPAEPPQATPALANAPADPYGLILANFVRNSGPHSNHARYIFWTSKNLTASLRAEFVFIFHMLVYFTPIFFMICPEPNTVNFNPIIV